MIQTILLFAMILCMPLAHAQQHTIGVHALSFHSRSGYQTYVDLPSEDKRYRFVKLGPYIKYEVFTPGVYYRHHTGATVGIYHNSYGDTSAYAGWTFNLLDYKGFTFDVSTIMLSGYHAHRGGPEWSPTILPSIAFPAVNNMRLRITGRPTNTRMADVGFVHLMVEQTF